MRTQSVCFCSGPPLWRLKKPRVWSQRFSSSRGELISQTLQAAVSHTATDERHKEEVQWEGTCLIRPQPSSLPSCLCLREHTTAVTQTAVYPLLSAAARGIIHRLQCQRRRNTKKEEMGSNIQLDVSLHHTTTTCCSACVSVFITRSSVKICCATCRWLGRNHFPVLLHIVHNAAIDSAHRFAGDSGGGWVCLAKKQRAKKPTPVNLILHISRSRKFQSLSARKQFKIRIYTARCKRVSSEINLVKNFFENVWTLNVNS